LYPRPTAEAPIYEIFTYGRFEVAPENEEAFVEAWTEFASWASERPGSIAIRLFRDVRNPGRFVSLGQWDDAGAVRGFKSAPEFKERLSRLVKLAAEFEPTEHVTLAKAIGGSAEAHSPPDDLEAIHAPT
jgi:heme-degrading monooxygenase HmoA